MCWIVEGLFHSVSILQLQMQAGAPFDLKEAICTIIYWSVFFTFINFCLLTLFLCFLAFSAPRLDAKELLEVRSQFILKYGAGFVLAVVASCSLLVSVRVCICVCRVVSCRVASCRVICVLCAFVYHSLTSMILHLSSYVSVFVDYRQGVCE